MGAIISKDLRSIDFPNGPPKQGDTSENTRHIQTPSKLFHEWNWTPSFTSLKSPDPCIVSETPHINYIDLRNYMPEVPCCMGHYDQVTKVMCTAIHYELARGPTTYAFPPSPDFLQYFMRHGTCQLHSFDHVMQVIQKYGLQEDGSSRQLPLSDVLLTEALSFRHIGLCELGIDDIVATLHTDQIILLGMPVYTSFVKTQIIPQLEINEDDRLLGGFCGIIVGYNNRNMYYNVMTCCGRDWGERGYIQIPYDVLPRVGCELRTIEIQSEKIKQDSQDSPHSPHSPKSPHSPHSPCRLPIY